MPDTIIIDATDQPVGRLAAKIAILLRGKQKAGFQPYLESPDVVLVKNAGRMKVTGRKLQQKLYVRHTGYLGGVKTKKMQDLFLAKPQEVLRKAVWGMLPKNKLRSRHIARLTFA